MGASHRFQPGHVDGLEPRHLLANAGPVTPALIGTLSPRRRLTGAALLYAQVNDAFDRFGRDYQQAQGAYLSSPTATARSAFASFTTQRVEVLGQELVRTLSRLPGSFAPLSKGDKSGQGFALRSFLYQQIRGGPDSLEARLTSNKILPPAETTGSAATLYTLAGSNAIQGIRVGSINALKYLIATSNGKK